MDVLCLGIAVADVVVKPVDELPPRGKLKLVDRIELHNGGGAVNTANALGKMGISTGIIGKVGRDGFGAFLVDVLHEFGVDTTGLKRDEEENTSSTIVLVHPDGERSFLHYLGANARITPADIDYKLVKEAKILHIAYAYLMPQLDGKPTVEILRRAKEMGVITSLDTAWDAQGRWWDLIRPYMPFVDIFLPSFEEARMISGKEKPEEIGEFFLEAGVKIMGLKMGKEGCFCTNGREVFHLPPYSVEVVDTTGAGDAFDAGFLAGIIKGWELEKTGRFANAVGALCVTAIGASRGIRNFEETLAFIGEG